MEKKLIEFIQNDCIKAASWSHTILSDLKNHKILIIGGTGFMGSWLAEFIAFLNDKYQFNCSLVLMARNTDAFMDEKKHLSKRKDIQLISKDIRNIIDLPRDISYIIHAGASPDNRIHVSKPIDTISTIYSGSNNLFETTLNLSNLKKILYLSSGQVYGKQVPQQDLINEYKFGSLDCNSITSIYPEAKRLAEATCCAYSSQYKLPIVIGRPFSFIGPYQSLAKPWAINNFIYDALNFKKIRIIGNGEPVRTYMYPGDMVVWLLKILVSGKSGVAYNIGSSYKISLKNLAENISKVLNEKIDIEIKNYNNDDSIFAPDIENGINNLNLKITYDAEETISRSINWFKISM